MPDREISARVFPALVAISRDCGSTEQFWNVMYSMLVNSKTQEKSDATHRFFRFYSATAVGRIPNFREMGRGGAIRVNSRAHRAHPPFPNRESIFEIEIGFDDWT
jgi:hypothetical protein